MMKTTCKIICIACISSILFTGCSGPANNSTEISRMNSEITDLNHELMEVEKQALMKQERVILLDSKSSIMEQRMRRQEDLMIGLLTKIEVLNRTVAMQQKSGGETVVVVTVDSKPEVELPALKSVLKPKAWPKSITAKFDGMVRNYTENDTAASDDTDNMGLVGSVLPLTRFIGSDARILDLNDSIGKKGGATKKKRKG